VLQSYPEYDESKIALQAIEYVVQVNSKIRGKISASPDISQAELESIARKDEYVNKHIGDKPLRKVIFVPNKLINFIV
jgi:leucyl-tRNA synthetase